MQAVAVSVDAILEWMLHALEGAEPTRAQSQRTLEMLQASPAAALTMAQLAVHQQLPAHMRLFASILFKGAVERYWRAHPESQHAGFSAHDKQQMRATFAHGFSEPDNKIAEQIGLTIAKVARLDFPQQWPEALSFLASRITGGNLESLRAAQYLQGVVKALCSRRLPSAIAQLRSMSLSIFGSVAHVWQQALQGGEAMYPIASILSKLLSALVTYGFEALPPQVVQWCEALPAFVHELYRRATTNVELCRTLRALQKILFSCVDKHAASCGTAVGPMLELSFSIVQQVPPDSFLQLRALSLLRTAVNLMGEGEEATPAAAASIRAAFGADRVMALCNVLLQHFMPLTSGELKFWEEEPESFTDDDANTARSEAESLLLALIEHAEQVMSVVLSRVCTEYWQQEHTDLHAALVEDGLLRLAGLGEYKLGFLPAFPQALLARCVRLLRVEAMVQRTHPWARCVLVRRAAWVLSCWKRHMDEGDWRLQLYPLLVHHISQTRGADIVMAISCGDCLQSLIEDVDFVVETFLSFLQGALSSMLALVSACSEVENKLKMAQGLAAMLNACGEHLKPFVSNLIGPLCDMWRLAEGEYVFLGVVMSCYGAVVEALDYECDSFVASVCVPCVRASVGAAGEAVCLHEDGVDLLKRSLFCVSALSPELASCAALVPLMLNSPSFTSITDAMQNVLRVLRAFAFLGGDEFCKTYGTAVASGLHTVVRSVKSSFAIPAVQLATQWVTLFGAPWVAMLGPLLGDAAMLLCNEQEHLVMRSACAALMARVLLHAPDMFGTVLGLVAPHCPAGKVPVVHLMSLWAVLLDNMGSMEDRRAVVFAALRLLSSDAQLVPMVGEVVNMVAQVSFDAFEVLTHSDGFATAEHSAMSISTYRARLRDPVVVSDLCGHALATLQQLSTNPSYAHHVAAVDPAIIQQVQAAMALRQQQQQQQQLSPQQGR